jgi:hypothetical protein
MKLFSFVVNKTVGFSDPLPLEDMVRLTGADLSVWMLFYSTKYNVSLLFIGFIGQNNFKRNFVYFFFPIEIHFRLITQGLYRQHQWPPALISDLL